MQHSELSSIDPNPAKTHGIADEALFPGELQQPEISVDQIALAQVLARSKDVTAIDAPVSNVQLELSSLRPAESILNHPSSAAGLPEEHSNQGMFAPQKTPTELGSLLAEVLFVMACTACQVTSSLIVGHITVTQTVFREALGILPAETPWLIGSSALSSGLSVIISGSIADLTPPKSLMVGAFLWGAIWNAATAVAVHTNLKILFFVARAMIGLAVGVLATASMSVLGRVYNPGIRKTRVFSFMAAGSPFGFWIG